MKKILFLSLLTLCFLVSCNDTAKAQITLYKATASTYASSTAQSSDTITNTGTTYFSTRLGDLNKYTSSSYRTYFTLDTTSGTPATVYAIQEGSMDGTTWFPLNSQGLGTDGYNCDSLSVATASLANLQSTVVSTSGATKFVNGATRGSQCSRVLYYRVKFVGTGTQTVRIYNVKMIPFTH